MAYFTGKFDSDSMTAEHDGFTLTATLHPDDDSTPPWDREDGHGPVSDWRNPSTKAPGELVLNESGSKCRFYDLQEACRIAKRDGWGVPMHRIDIEHGANGLQRVNAQWFIGRELNTFQSGWTDDGGDAYREAYAAQRATYSSAKAYAAAAARADFDRLRDWCRDEWQYVGVMVTASRAGVNLASDSLWGIESDAGAYLVETANALAMEAIAAARTKVAELAG